MLGSFQALVMISNTCCGRSSHLLDRTSALARKCLARRCPPPPRRELLACVGLIQVVAARARSSGSDGTLVAVCLPLANSPDQQLARRPHSRGARVGRTVVPAADRHHLLSPTDRARRKWPPNEPCRGAISETSPPTWPERACCWFAASSGSGSLGFEGGESFTR